MKYNIEEMKKLVTQIFHETIKVCDHNKIHYYCQAGTVLGCIRHRGSIPWDHDADIVVPENELDKFIQCMKRELPDKYYVDFYRIDDSTLRQFPRIGIKGFSTDKLHLDVFRLIGLPNDELMQLNMVKEAHFYTTSNALMRQSFWKLIAKGRILFALGKLGIGKYNRTYFIEKFDELCKRFPYQTSKYVMNPSGKYGIRNIFKKEVYGDGILSDYEGFKVRIPSQSDFYLKQYYGDYMKIPSEEYITIEMEKTFEIK